MKGEKHVDQGYYSFNISDSFFFLLHLSSCIQRPSSFNKLSVLKVSDFTVAYLCELLFLKAVLKLQLVQLILNPALYQQGNC